MAPPQIQKFRKTGTQNCPFGHRQPGKKKKLNWKKCFEKILYFPFEKLKLKKGFIFVVFPTTAEGSFYGDFFFLKCTVGGHVGENF